MRNNIPDRYHGRANPFIEHWLKGPECKTIVGRQGNRALAIYLSIVAKRTGELAGSAAVDTHIGGVFNDRWVATVTVSAPYAASHEFGTGRTNPDHVQRAANDLNKVLNLMAGF